MDEETKQIVNTPLEDQLDAARNSAAYWQREYRLQTKKLEALRLAATRYPRCCDLWQDSGGEMHCRDCSQATFAMLREIQQLLGVNKNCDQIAVATQEPKE